MTASTELELYLRAFSTRLKQVCLARGSAILAIAFVFVGAGFAYYAISTGFADAVVYSGRLALLACIGAVIYLLIIKPVNRLKHNAALDIERRIPQFGGRIITYQQLRDHANPFRELLAEDTLKVSADFPVDRQVRQREFTLPGAITGGCIALLLILLIAGPGLMNYSLRHLLAGWAWPGLLPPQTIEVAPGDELIRRGGNVRVSAVMSGFDPEQAQVHVKMGDKDWQSVAMVHRPEGFEFTFFSVREPLQYYVSTTGIRSPAYTVEVVDLPEIRNLKLTFHYPAWTKREPETVEYGGDIRTVSGTQVDLEVVTEQPLPAGLLVLNDQQQKLAADGAAARTSFDITGDGQYYVAAQLGDELVRLSDDYFIKVVEDGKPEIRLLRPGRDWNASNIEEVTTRIEVRDDYALEALELKYSINGGAWKSISMQHEERDAVIDHTFFLEDMQSDPAEQDSRLVPGDLIAYYAEALDRLNSSQSDMYFIQVQPFDRRYTQSQQMGGGGGGMGNQQQEISQRQKEIIVSTWNLIRKQTGGPDESEALSVRDNATLLSELQETLAEQARTLADRTRARELTTVDEQIKIFVENMEQAVAAMHPAAERLAETDLQAAIQPEQEALQHLLRAEAVFNDIQVSFQRGQRGGGGFSAGRDLAEMFELEMDLEKNQYETGSSASRQSPTQDADTAMQKLEELARRQEQLASNLLRQQQLSEAQRWQQEMLRREAEELQRQLENLQRQQASSGQGQSSQEGGSEGSSSELSRRLGSAIRAMNEATEAMRGNSNSERLQQAVQEAQRQLQQARSQIAADQQQSMQQAFQDMADRAATMHRQQARIDETLQNAVREALASRRDGEDTVMNPLTYDEEVALADSKRSILEELQSLRQAMQSSARNFQDTAPEAVKELDQAGAELRDAQIDTRLNIAASYIEQGAALYIAGSESVVTNALRSLRDNLERAEALAMGSDRPGDNALDRALSQTRSLRRELQQLADGGQTGDIRDIDIQQPVQGNQGNNGGQAGQDTPAGGRRGGTYGNGGWDGWRRPYGVITPERIDRINRDVDETAGIINPIIPELRDQGLSDAEIDELYRLLRELTYAPMDDQKNELILQQEMTKTLALLEQLELQLERGQKREQPGTVRSKVTEPVPAEYKDAVAEYYRRLSNEDK